MASLGKFLRFASLGSIAALTYFLLFLSANALGCGRQSSVAVAAVLVAAISYTGQYQWTFKPETKHRVSVPTFPCQAAVAYAVAAGGTYILGTLALWPAWSVALMLTLAMLVFTFLAMHFWVFC
jgi:putative flippase GtrA